MTSPSNVVDLSRRHCDHREVTTGNDAKTPTCMECGDERPAEDLTPEGIQLVIPGAERVVPASQKQLDLF